MAKKHSISVLAQLFGAKVNVEKSVLAVMELQAEGNETVDDAKLQKLVDDMQAVRDQFENLIAEAE